MLLRVLTVHDAREWLLPLPEGAQLLRVADVKRLVQEQEQQAAAVGACSEAAPAAADDGDESFVVFRGRILADVDVVDLNALAAADFLVLAREPAPPQQGDRVAKAEAENTQLRALQPALDELEMLGVRRVAAADGFRAAMLLKEEVSTAALEQFNTHPSAAVTYWRLPLERAEDAEAEDCKEADGEADVDVIDRLASMGFERDLVAAVYESCGRHEEAALSALCEMLQ